MKPYRVQMKIGLKLIGVVAVIWGLSNLSSIIVYLVSELWADRWFYTDDPYLFIVAQIIGPTTMFAAGCYLIFDGRHVLNLLAPLDVTCCYACGYDLQHVTAEHCPECGTPRMSDTPSTPDRS